MAITPERTNVVILGDSLTWLGGDDCSKARGWNRWFREAFHPLTCRSYARSGATWTNTEATALDTVENIGRLGDNNVVFNQVKRLEGAVASAHQATPDLILIALGTNDAWFPKDRPDAYKCTPDSALATLPAYADAAPSDVRTLSQSVMYITHMLSRDYPEARIVLITPPQTTAVTLEKIHQTGDIIEACGKLLGLQVIRMDRLGAIQRKQELVRKTHTYDGTHTNERGARRNGELIAREVARGH